MACFTATPALACLNDTQVEAAEREFRSSYERNESAAAAPSPTMNPMAIGALVGGSGLIGACGVVGVKRARRGA
jgi:hypothetical protein